MTQQSNLFENDDPNNRKGGRDETDDGGHSARAIKPSAASEIDADQPLRTIAWMTTDQVEIVQSIAKAVPLDLIAVGGSGSAAMLNISEALEADRCVDFRHQVLNDAPDLVWILTTEGLADDEFAVLQHQIERPVLTLEPLPSGIADCPRGDSPRHVRFIPPMRQSRMMSVFDEVRESFGAVRSVSVTTRAQHRHGSLYARLTDALDVLEYVCGSAEQFDTAMSGPLQEAPSSLRGLHGHLTVNARFAENCCACVLASDLGASWSRGMTVLGEGGCVRLTDEFFEWRSHDGEVVDSSSIRQSDPVDSRPTGMGLPEHLYLESIRAIRQPGWRHAAPINQERIVAACEAIRLSLRTGQGETPRKILEMIQSSQ